jgi:RNA polymerase sigma-70 factor (ECF subfamily)
MNAKLAGEEELVERARNGDTQAFSALVLAYQTFAYNLALRAVGDPLEAQDLTQEAFVRAWQGLPGFRGQSGFRTWLYRIVVNACYNRSPALRREMAELDLECGEALHLAARSPDPQQSIEAADLRRRLREAIEGLPLGYRMLVLLRYQQGLSYEEIAGVLDAPLGTVKAGLFRAHAILKTVLEKALLVEKAAVYE